MHRNITRIDLAGQTFGLLTVSHLDGRIGRNAAWICRCTCGQEVRVRGDRLRAGLRKACAVNGHLWQSTKPPGVTARFRSEHQSWRNMRGRCTDKRHKNYKNYGGRGVVVCDRWREFKNFLDDMGRRPSREHTIERNDTNGNYEPANCRWATQAEQHRNMRNNVYVEYEGERMLLLDVVEKLGVPRGIVYARLKNKWTLEEALGTPLKKYKKKK